jgi:hypothetical protein
MLSVSATLDIVASMTRKRHDIGETMLLNIFMYEYNINIGFYVIQRSLEEEDGFKRGLWQ